MLFLFVFVFLSRLLKFCSECRLCVLFYVSVFMLVYVQHATVQAFEYLVSNLCVCVCMAACVPFYNLSSFYVYTL